MPIDRLQADARDPMMVTSMSSSIARAIMLLVASIVPGRFVGDDHATIVDALATIVALGIYSWWSLMDKRKLRDAMPRPETLVEKGEDV